MTCTRLLVANRGEIAVRIIRAARDLGIDTVAIYSEADRGAYHTQLADLAVCIGPPAASRSYLHHEAVLAAALATDCDAVHPGYGFLAEDATFARACTERGMTFVGPPAEVIAKMGDKNVARTVMRDAGVATVDGSTGTVGTTEEAEAVAERIGYPVLLKARAGGGGRGMRVVAARDELSNAFRSASREAAEAFSDGGLYLEQYLHPVRHIEVQVLADNHGRTLHLGERDCSLQRRHQKIIEEAPSPGLTPRLREELGQTAVRAASSVGYVSAGTIEFLFSPEREKAYFIEMNTRIQVEHPVTEAITGIDLVAWQLLIAQGERLHLTQEDVAWSGHALECRINAEDVDRGSIPVPGTIGEFTQPGGVGVRTDTHCQPGSTIPPYYDSLLAKLIVVAGDRPSALQRMRRAIGELHVTGVPTNAALHQRILADPCFVAGDVNTRTLEGLLREA